MILKMPSFPPEDAETLITGMHRMRLETYTAAFIIGYCLCGSVGAVWFGWSKHVILPGFAAVILIGFSLRLFKPRRCLDRDEVISANRQFHQLQQEFMNRFWSTKSLQFVSLLTILMMIFVLKRGAPYN
jgi:hypothetical protein